MYFKGIVLQYEGSTSICESGVPVKVYAKNVILYQRILKGCNAKLYSKYTYETKSKGCNIYFFHRNLHLFILFIYT